MNSDEELVLSLWDDELEDYTEVGIVKIVDEDKLEQRTMSTDVMITFG